MNPLKAKILDRIRKEGPITVAEYMRMALTDPEHGYYMRRDPFGAAGDFITAPEVSQMFGETLGLFFVQAWEDRGRPEQFHLVELGPGRGTLMADMLRAASIRPRFLDAAEMVLLESSPVLRGVQQRALAKHRPRWIGSLDELDRKPLFLVANEFLDALPVSQFVKSESGWHVRTVETRDGRLAFGRHHTLADINTLDTASAPAGAIAEFGDEAEGCARTIARFVAKNGGIALIVDYGYSVRGLGDTLQAVQGHAYADPLADPGDADLTAHVDFDTLARAARAEGVKVARPMTQKVFLESLGIRERAARLKHANPSDAQQIASALHRLTAEDQMGTLFKVLIIGDGQSERPSQ